jgi:hypothetical protein
MFGNVVIDWIVRLVVAVCVFWIADWLLGALAAFLGLAVPENVIKAVAVLIAIAFVYSWHIGRWGYRTVA